MTEKQFARATQISQKINELIDTKNEINNRQNCYLSYSYKDTSGNKQCAYWRMITIKNILDKHDKMIREEIDEEIRKLQEEIKTL